MRNVLLTLAAATAAVTIAAPASAQWAPPTYRYQPYDYGSGFSGDAFADAMQRRVQRIRGDVYTMEEQQILSFREARTLDHEARDIQRGIWRDSGNGIQPGEARRIEYRIRQLEYRLSREAYDWDSRPGFGRY